MVHFAKGLLVGVGALLREHVRNNAWQVVGVDEVGKVEMKS